MVTSGLGDSSSVISWLLEASPSIRYRTLRELLHRPVDDPEVVAARAELARSPEVSRIFERVDPSGCWLAKKSDGRWIGDGVEYGAFNTTHFVLAQLAELGLDRRDPRVERSANRYLDLVTPEGDFWQHMSCLSGFNVRTFVMLGFGDDPRLRRAVELLLRTERADGGYLCDMHERKRKRRTVASCARGAAKVLFAFAEVPAARSTPRCEALVGYFLRRGGVFRRNDRSMPVTRESALTVFPFTWGCGLIDVLLGLATLGCGKRPELAAAWAALDSKRDADGRYRLDWTPSQSLLRAGKRGEPNPWVTFYALLARARLASATGREPALAGTPPRARGRTVR